VSATVLGVLRTPVQILLLASTRRFVLCNPRPLAVLTSLLPASLAAFSARRPRCGFDAPRTLLCCRREQPRTGKPRSCRGLQRRRAGGWSREADGLLCGSSPAFLAGRYKVNLPWVTSWLSISVCCLADVACRA